MRNLSTPNIKLQNNYTYMDTIDLSKVYTMLNSRTIFNISYEELKSLCNIILSELSNIKAFDEDDNDKLYELIESFKIIQDNCFDNNEVFHSEDEAVMMLNVYLSELQDWANTIIYSLIFKTFRRCNIITKEAKKVFIVKIRKHRYPCEVK